MINSDLLTLLKFLCVNGRTYIFCTLKGIRGFEKCHSQWSKHVRGVFRAGRDGLSIRNVVYILQKSFTIRRSRSRWSRMLSRVRERSGGDSRQFCERNCTQTWRGWRRRLRSRWLDENWLVIATHAKNGEQVSFADIMTFRAQCLLLSSFQQRLQFATRICLYMNATAGFDWAQMRLWVKITLHASRRKVNATKRTE